jgi:hypothetical protein
MAGVDWLVVAEIAIAIAAGVAAYVMASNIEQEFHPPDPRGDLSATTVREGDPIPVIFGTVRCPGTLLWYGNVTSEAVYSEAEGGKGGGGGGQVFEGYNYYADVWEAICAGGAVELIETYVNDNKYRTIQASDTTWNDGTGDEVPPFELTVNQALGVAIKMEFNETDDCFEGKATYLPVVPNTFSMLNWVNCHDDGDGYLMSTAGDIVGEIDYDSGEIWMDNQAVFGYASVHALVDSGQLPAYYDTVCNFCYGILSENITAFVNKLPGVCHASYTQWFLGKGVYQVPVINFVVKRTLDSPVTYANMTNGCNAAAVIYNLLTDKFYGGQMSADDIDLDLFNAAAAIWNTKGYGINMRINQQKTIEAWIESILNQVGGSFYTTNENKMAVHAFTDSETPVDSLDETDFSEFKFTRQSWSTTANDIRIDFTDAKNDYVVRTIGFYDPANANAQRRVVEKKIDLSYFTDKAAVSRRGWEILKANSYPGAVFSFKLNRGHQAIFPGCCIEISHSDYSITNLRVRITKIEFGEPDATELSYSAEQIVDQLIDDNFQQIGQPDQPWISPDYTPQALPHQAVKEMPWNPITQTKQAFAFLAARSGLEDICYIFRSLNSGSEYVPHQSFGVFSQQGVLDVAYPATTFEVDDDVGIIYTPHSNDLDPGDLSRARLFLDRRFAIIGNEIMAFQDHDPYGTTQYIMTGVIRGMFGTPVETHAAGAEVWIFYASDQIQLIDLTSVFYIKMLPGSQGDVLDSSLATAIAVTPAQKAKTPFAPELVEAIRSGSTVTLTWWPRTRALAGAGANGETIVDANPMIYDGDFEYSINGGTGVLINATTLTYTNAASFTFQVRNRVDGYYSAWTVSLAVGAADGRYLSEIGLVTY